MGEASPKVIKIVKDFKEKAEKKYGIGKVILFGSYATGKTREGSDIDLLVVANRFRSRADFMSRLFREWHIVQKKRNPVDFICFTEKEFNKLSKQITIVKQALEEGVRI